jgi:hypothetical protein
MTAMRIKLSIEVFLVDFQSRSTSDRLKAAGGVLRQWR